MTEVFVPLGKHLFSAEALNKIAADALTKIPPDKTSAIVGGVDANGANVALVLTKHGAKADVKFVTALEHDWAGGNALGASGVIAFCLALLLALPVSAQPIHGHPQKAAYATLDERPAVDSAQCHWSPGNAVIPPASLLVEELKNGTFVPLISHTHVDMEQPPRYAEFNAPFTIHFTLKLFQTAGHINGSEVYAGILRGRDARDLIWDDTGTSTAPVMEGDPAPHALRQWGGQFTIDPDPKWPHGWIDLSLAVVTRFDNGDSILTNLLEPVFSTLDVTQPDTNDPAYPQFSAQCEPGSPRRPDVSFGFQEMNVVDMLPLAPISVNWTFREDALGYNLGVLPIATYEYRADLDIHHDIPGRTLASATFVSNIIRTETFDPIVLGTGTHKIALMNTQPDGGLEQVTALLVTDLTIDPNAPPITLPPVAAPPPAVTPPPPPPPPPPDPVPPPIQTFVLPLTVMICDSSLPPKCLTKP